MWVCCVFNLNFDLGFPREHLIYITHYTNLNTRKSLAWCSERPSHFSLVIFHQGNNKWISTEEVFQTACILHKHVEWQGKAPTVAKKLPQLTLPKIYFHSWEGMESWPTSKENHSGPSWISLALKKKKKPSHTISVLNVTNV